MKLRFLRKRTLLRHAKKTFRRFLYRGRCLKCGPRGARAIAERLDDPAPAAIAKIGGLELQAAVLFDHHQGKAANIEWGRTGERLHRNAGVFPPEAPAFEVFCRIYLEALGQVDILAVWDNPGEARIVNEHARYAMLTDLSAFQDPGTMISWAARLKGRRVLVLHPFAKTLRSQYLRGNALWPGLPDMLPGFRLETVRVPLSAALAPSPFETWKDGLERLQRRMDAIDYEIALIGAGAWSLPLAVHAKRSGRKGFHLGGMTQVLFGIKGGRWDHDRSVAPHYNDHWVRPSPEETPPDAHLVERGCYW